MSTREKMRKSIAKSDAQELRLAVQVIKRLRLTFPNTSRNAVIRVLMETSAELEGASDD